jgi:hypothetical protein
MTTFVHRLLGAARLDSRIYEEVEADRQATLQAVVVVLMASAAGGIGLLGLESSAPELVLARIAGALLGWLSWATLTYLIGTQFLSEPQTRADVGELLRTLAFASSPGLLRIFGLIPHIGVTIYAVASGWMLVAMIVAVRQALDYRETWRAIAVCVVGWVLSLALAAVIGNAFATVVS